MSEVPLRAVALIRMSSAKQVNSPERQRSLFLAYCERWSLIPVSEYEDLAISATHTKLEDRAGIMAMLSDADRGLFNIVWTEEQSRASRDPLEIVPIQRHLATLGIPIVENSEDPRQAVLSAERELLTTVRAALSRYEVRQLGARVKRSLRNRMEKGLLCGKLPAGLCWDPVGGRYVVDESTAALPRRAFRLFLEVRNVSQVVRQLHAEGYRGPTAAPLSRAGVMFLLKQPAYRGRLRWEKVEIPVDLPQVVPEEDVASVDSLLALASGRPQRAVHAKALFSGVLKCQSCGAWLCTVQARSRRPCYRCPRAYYTVAQPCQNRGGRAEAVIETAVLPTIAASLREIADRINTEPKPRRRGPSSGADLTRLEQSRIRAESLFVDGVITRQRLDEEIARLEATRQEALRTPPPKKQPTTAEVRAVADALEKHWPNWSRESQRELLLSMVDHIVLDRDEPEKSVVVWRNDAELGYVSESMAAPAF